MVHCYSLDQDLTAIEQQHGVQQRWNKQDPLYQCAFMQQAQNSCQALVKEIQKGARQRWFLLSLKAKFARWFCIELHDNWQIILLCTNLASCTLHDVGSLYYHYSIPSMHVSFHVDGHQMSTKIAKNVGKVTKSLKAMINNYNSRRMTLTPPHSDDLPTEITWDQTTDPSAPLWVTRMATIGVPASVRQEAVQKHFLLLRCKEEVSLLKQEMHRVMVHTHGRMVKLVDSLAASSDSLTLTACGARSLIMARVYELSKAAEKFDAMFSPHVDLPPLPAAADTIVAEFAEPPFMDDMNSASEAAIDEEWVSLPQLPLNEDFLGLCESSSDSDSDDSVI